ncbi:MAG: hypothetical protein KAH25_11450 [Bacteroidales bacterium]|nr:hypothetical protein [Bacteroidales bacterium]
MKNFTLLLVSALLSVSLSAQLSISGPSVKNYTSKSTKTGLVLYSQMTPSGNAIASQEFPDFGNSRVQSADDFMVPAGAEWDIVAVETIGMYYNGPGPAPTFIIEIYSDTPGLPNTLLFSQSDLPYTEVGNLFSIDLSTPIHLNTGHYWVSVMAKMEYGNGGQWGWQQHEVPQINHEFANQDPDQLFVGAWPATWGPGSITMGNSASYDFCFSLIGDNPPSVPISNWPIYLSIFLISLFIIFKIKK